MQVLRLNADTSKGAWIICNENIMLGLQKCRYLIRQGPDHRFKGFEFNSSYSQYL